MCCFEACEPLSLSRLAGHHGLKDRRSLVCDTPSLLRSFGLSELGSRVIPSEERRARRLLQSIQAALFSPFDDTVYVAAYTVYVLMHSLR